MSKCCIVYGAKLPDTVSSRISCGAGEPATYVCRSRAEFFFSVKNEIESNRRREALCIARTAGIR